MKYLKKVPKKFNEQPFISRIGRCLGLTTLLLSAFTVNTAYASTVYDFEGFADNTNLVNQIAGINFSNATVFTAGVSLNEISFPPKSGLNVVASDLDTISLAFNNPVFAVSGYFTFADQIILEAFDINNILLGSVQSVAANVLGSWENIAISYSGISLLKITGASQFTVDDLSIASAPEPSALLLIGAGGLLGARLKKKSAFARNSLNA